MHQEFIYMVGESYYFMVPVSSSIPGMSFQFNLFVALHKFDSMLYHFGVGEMCSSQ